MTWNKRISVEERKSNLFLWSIQEQEDSIWNIDKLLRGPRKEKVRFYNFISIEFEYQNSWYSHDSMAQVHLLFDFLDFSFFRGIWLEQQRNGNTLVWRFTILIGYLEYLCPRTKNRNNMRRGIACSELHSSPPTKYDYLS